MRFLLFLLETVIGTVAEAVYITVITTIVLKCAMVKKVATFFSTARTSDSAVNRDYKYLS